MKTLITLSLCVGGLLNAFAGESNSLKAERISPPRLDVFNMSSIESLLGTPRAVNITTYEIVLITTDSDDKREVYKYDVQHNGDFNSIMTKVKKYAKAGAILYVDEIKTANGDKLPEQGFYLR